MFPQSEIFYPTLTPPQTTEDGMMGRRLDQQQVQEESLIAVLIIEDNDRQELWPNCGALVYNLRTPDARHQIQAPSYTHLHHNYRCEDRSGIESLRGCRSQWGRDENEDVGPR